MKDLLRFVETVCLSWYVELENQLGMVKRILLLAVGLLLVSCDSGEERQQGITSSQFSVCNNLLSACNQGNGSYCLFGYKWGNTNQFSPSGFDVEGPRETGGSVTFSFQNASNELNTHRQIDVAVRPFNELLDCARDQVRKAMNDWAAVSGIEFVEMAEGSDSDIRFFAADIVQSGIGYPNYEEGRCGAFSGNVIIKPNSRFSTCELFYRFVLHEIGHALGLGHVNSTNIMNPEILELHDGLQPGDIEGIRALYGENR